MRMGEGVQCQLVSDRPWGVVWSLVWLLWHILHWGWERGGHSQETGMAEGGGGVRWGVRSVFECEGQGSLARCLSGQSSGQ